MIAPAQSTFWRPVADAWAWSRTAIGSMGLFLLAAAVVAMSAAMSVMANVRGSLSDLTVADQFLIAGTLLAEVIILFGPMLVLARRRWAASLLLMPLIVMCASLTYQSVNKFVLEQVLNRAASIHRAAEDYAAADGLVRTLRTRRAAILELRSVGEIDAAVASELARGAGRSTVAATTGDCERAPSAAADACGRVAELRRAREQATSRDALDVQIVDATRARARMEALADMTAAERLRVGGAGDGSAARGGLLGAARWATGLDIRTAEELRAVTLALAIWLGSLLLPMIVAMGRAASSSHGVGAHGAGHMRALWAGWRSSAYGRADPHPSAEPPEAPDKTPADTNETPAPVPHRPNVALPVVEQWRAARLTPRIGCQLQAALAYEDFAAWADREGHDVCTAAVFGTLLGRECGIEKTRGAGGRNYYRDVDLVRVKAPDRRPRVPALALATVSGGAA